MWTICYTSRNNSKIREPGNLEIYRNGSNKACFVHDAAYSDTKDLSKRTISDKILQNRSYEIDRNRKYDGYQRALASMVNKFFDKKTGLGISVNEKPEELHKQVLKEFKRRKVYGRLKDNIWAVDLAEMRSLSSKNKNVKYILCVIDVFSINAWVKPFKDKKSKTVLNVFIEIVNESNRKPNKLWIDQGREFYNKLMQEWLDK